MNAQALGEQFGRYLGALAKPVLWGLLVAGTGMAIFPSARSSLTAGLVIGAVLAAVKPPRGTRLMDLPQRSKLLRVVLATAVAVAAAAAGVAPSVFVLGALLHLAFKAMRWQPLPVAVVSGCVGVLLAAGWFVPTAGPHVLLTSGDPVSLAHAGRDLVRFVALALLIVAATQDQRVLDAARAAGEQAVRDERSRIARELHDVVAHHVSVMTIQSEAAASGMAPGSKAAGAMRAAAESGRTAMTELRRMLGVLRSADGTSGGGEIAPQPGLDDVFGLVDEIRATGTPIDVEVEGQPPATVSDGLGLSVYRIVQESLTNGLKHAPGAAITVRLAYGPSAVRVEVESRGPVGKVGSGGHGIIGMRERAQLLDGALTAGPTEDGTGWRVRADLPLDHDAAAVPAT
jgi:signal transduction histidine kinase